MVILTQPKGFYKRKTLLMPVFHVAMRKYPAIVKAMARRHVMYNEQLRYLHQQEKDGNILLVYPQDTLPIGRTQQSEQKMLMVYRMGRKAGESHLKNIKEFVERCEEE